MDLVKLNENRIAGALLNRIPVRVFDALDSTNDEAKRAVKNGLSEATLFLSETQTKGRGRNGHDFYSPKYEGLYMTLAYPAESFGQEILRVTAKTAVAVSRGIQETFGTEVGIKWVNDLYLGEEKAGGILVEHMSVPEWLLIGIGINVTTAKFPSDLIGKARALSALMPIMRT